MSDLGSKEILSKNLNRYLELSGKTRNEICSDLGIKYSTFTDWINGNKYPRIDNIEMMANYFHIKKSDLIERKSVLEQKEEMFLDNEAREMLEAYNSRSDLKILFKYLKNLSPEKAQIMINIVEGMKKLDN